MHKQKQLCRTVPEFFAVGNLQHLRVGLVPRSLGCKGIISRGIYSSYIAPTRSCHGLSRTDLQHRPPSLTRLHPKLQSLRGSTEAMAPSSKDPKIE